MTKLVLSVEHGLELFYFCTRLCMLNLVFLYCERVFGGWVDMYKKGEVGWKWFSIFYSRLTFVC